MILQASKAVKDNGTVYFQIHEGDRSGNGRITKRQERKKKLAESSKAEFYVDEIKQHFKTVERHGNLILAKDPIYNATKAVWFLEESMAAGPVYYQSASWDSGKAQF